MLRNIRVPGTDGTVNPARTPTDGIIINTSKHAKSAGNGRSRDSSCRSVNVWTVAAEQVETWPCQENDAAHDELGQAGNETGYGM